MERHASLFVFAPLLALATLLGGCGGSISDDFHSVVDLHAPDASDDAAAPGSSDTTPTCATAAAALCNAANTCGSQQAMAFDSCEEGLAWASLDDCIAELTASCEPDASVGSNTPVIVDPAACMSALPKACIVPANPRLEIPASCATCTVQPGDAG
jgi:hypothetical protein